MSDCKRIDVWLMERCQTNGVISDMGEMLPCAKNKHQTDGETSDCGKNIRLCKDRYQAEMSDHVRTDVRLINKSQTMHGQLSD